MGQVKIGGGNCLSITRTIGRRLKSIDDSRLIHPLIGYIRFDHLPTHTRSATSTTSSIIKQNTSYSSSIPSLVICSIISFLHACYILKIGDARFDVCHDLLYMYCVYSVVGSVLSSFGICLRTQIYISRRTCWVELYST